MNDQGNGSAPTTSSQDLMGTSLGLNSIDQLTISYLKGEISFQQYETMIENQHFRNELMLNRLNSIQMDALIFDHIELNPQGNLIEPTDSSNSASTSGKSLKNRDRSNSLSPTKRKSTDDFNPKKKDKYLSLKSIIADDPELSNLDINFEDDDEDDDDENGENRGNNNEKLSKSSRIMDDFDDNSNWNDFDIETLNFDKFIKDHQQNKSDSNREDGSSKNTEETGETKKSSKRKKMKMLIRLN